MLRPHLPPPSASRGLPLQSVRKAVHGGDGALSQPALRQCHAVVRWNIAAAVRSGPVEAALNAYKYRGARQWAPVFGGMLAELMERRRHLVEPFDLITASPTFVGRSDRDFDHTRSMLVEAAHLVPSGRAWPFDTGPVPAIVKMRPTPRLARLDHRERRRVAEQELRPALDVPDRSRTAGRRILVVDDVFTDGRTLDEVARRSGSKAVRARCAASPSAVSPGVRTQRLTLPRYRLAPCVWSEADRCGSHRATSGPALHRAPRHGHPRPARRPLLHLRSAGAPPPPRLEAAGLLVRERVLVAAPPVVRATPAGTRLAGCDLAPASLDLARSPITWPWSIFRRNCWPPTLECLDDRAGAAQGPDAVRPRRRALGAAATGSGRPPSARRRHPVAVELDLTPKRSARLDLLAGAYAVDRDVDTVWWYLPSEAAVSRTRMLVAARGLEHLIEPRLRRIAASAPIAQR